MRSENRELLVRGARQLGDLLKDVVFVGGCTTGLLITDPGAADVRTTRDVDVIVEVKSGRDYRLLENKLQSLGFRNDAHVICRWQHDDAITLDVMPTDAQILGFSNPWYVDAVEHSVRYELEKNLVIRVVTPPYFCATKIVAFHGRGHGDYAGSHDLEDLIAVIDGRTELLDEIAAAKQDVREYIAEEVATLVTTPAFRDALPGHLPYDRASQARAPILRHRLDQIAALGRQ